MSEMLVDAEQRVARVLSGPGLRICTSSASSTEQPSSTPSLSNSKSRSSHISHAEPSRFGGGSGTLTPLCSQRGSVLLET